MYYRPLFLLSLISYPEVSFTTGGTVYIFDNMLLSPKLSEPINAGSFCRWRRSKETRHFKTLNKKTYNKTKEAPHLTSMWLNTRENTSSELPANISFGTCLFLPEIATLYACLLQILLPTRPHPLVKFDSCHGQLFFLYWI